MDTTTAGREVSTRWTAALVLTTVGTFVGWYGPLQILLAKQADVIDPFGKEALLATVAALGAVCSMVANPVWGALSDRTTGRWGRRRPWVLGGSVAGAAGLVVLAQAESVLGMVVGWCLVQVALNAPLAALSAAIPDRVPEARRGVIGGWFGLAQTAGVMGGTGLAVAGGTIAAGYLICAAVVVLAALPFTALREEPAAVRPRGPLLRGFVIDPRRYPDFGWAWLTRFLMNLGNAIALLYLLYFLDDAVGVEDPESGVLVLTALYAVALLSTVVVAGAWSDRAGARRVFVAGSGVVMAVAAVLLAVWQTWTGSVVAALVLGVGFGAYTAVDFALITQVLPAAADRGKDLGLVNIANTLPQVLAPVIAAPIVRSAGGYPALYAVAAAVGLLGAVLVFRIRSVR
ncbi:MFS transporter [Actinokineospora soli]|uniref:MFS transporter n=1 Tax=Actinokineospora soli TaxID=1048753 RepID=A0ABW2TLM0_9PSEU